jgi:hypothetical protein
MQAIGAAHAVDHSSFTMFAKRSLAIWNHGRNDSGDVRVIGSGQRPGGSLMLFAKIVIWWIVLSCTLGPLSSWLFFYGKREARQGRQVGPRAISYRPRLQLTYYGRGHAHVR